MEKAKNITKLDAKESAYFIRQLEYLKSKSYDTKYKELRFSNFVPVSTEVPSGTETITYRKYSFIGMAKIISNYAKDFPRVDLYGEEFSRKVKDLGASFGYNLKEIRQAAITGNNLNPQRARIAQRAIMQLHQEIALWGSEEYNLHGFLNNDEITVSGIAKIFADLTPDEVLFEINAAITGIIVLTNGVENPNQILLPIAQYRSLASIRMTDGDSSTILKFLLDTNPGLSIDWLAELAEAGDSGEDRMMVYDRDIDSVVCDIPVLYEQFEAEKENMEYKVPCHGENAGVVFYYPLSAKYVDGI